MLGDINKSQRVQFPPPLDVPAISHLPRYSSGPSTRKCLWSLGARYTRPTLTLKHTLSDTATDSYTDTFRHPHPGSDT